jgi:hypothetical protein
MLKKPTIILGLKTGQPMLNRNDQPDYRGIDRPIPPPFFQKGGIIDMMDGKSDIRKGNYYQRKY